MITKLITLPEKILRRKQLKNLNKNPKVSLLGNIRLGYPISFVIYPEMHSLEIGKDFNIRNYVHFIIGNNADLKIGYNVFMNNFCSVNCLEHIEIGDHTLFGENVKIYDHNHRYERTENGLRLSHSEFTTAPVKIGRNCWLGSNVTVLKGVTIGDNCIIGAGCTIAKDVPANSTVINQQQLIFK